MIDRITKMIVSYGDTGGIAEQALSSRRTVYSYVGESRTLEKFSQTPQNIMEFRIKSGIVKGLMLGSMGVIYAGWGFEAWVDTYLITEKGEKGGKFFIAGFNVLMGGLFGNGSAQRFIMFFNFQNSFQTSPLSSSIHFIFPSALGTKAATVSYLEFGSFRREFASKAIFLVLLSASLFLVDLALAFKAEVLTAPGSLEVRISPGKISVGRR